MGVPAVQNSIGCLIEAISLPPPLISINSPAWPDEAAPACLQMLNYACHMKTKPISSPPTLPPHCFVFSLRSDYNCSFYANPKQTDPAQPAPCVFPA